MIKYILLFIVFCIFNAFSQIEVLFPSYRVSSINDIKFFNDSLGFAYGESGEIFKTTDGGESFSDISIFTAADILHVHFFNPLQGWASGTIGLYQTSDGGKTWIDRSFPNSMFSTVLKFANDTLGYCLNDRALYITKDAGNTFEFLFYESYPYEERNYENIEIYNDSTFVIFNEFGFMFSNDYGKTREKRADFNFYGHLNYAKLSNNIFYFVKWDYMYISTDTCKTFAYFRSYHHDHRDIKVFNDTIYVLDGMLFLQSVYGTDRIAYLMPNGASYIHIKNSNTFFFQGNTTNLFKYSDKGDYVKKIFNTPLKYVKYEVAENKVYINDQFSERTFISPYPFTTWDTVPKVPGTRLDENTLLLSKYVNYYLNDYFISDNNGGTWRSIFSNAYSLKVLKDSVMLAKKDTNLFISTDFGYTWQIQRSNRSLKYKEILLSDNNFVLLLDNSNTYISNDYAKSFTFLDSGYVKDYYFNLDDVFFYTKYVPTGDVSRLHLYRSSYDLINKYEIELAIQDYKSFFFVDSMNGYFLDRNGVYETNDAGKSIKLIFNKKCNSIYNVNNKLFASTTLGEFYFIKDLPISNSRILAIDEIKIPVEYSLYQNYPNPFNASTTIKYQLPQEGKTRLNIYNSLGSLVESIDLGNKTSGIYEYRYNAHNLASGVYFYEISSGTFINAKKFVMLK